jgi:hypothetical protein
MSKTKRLGGIEEVGVLAIKPKQILRAKLI